MRNISATLVQLYNATSNSSSDIKKYENRTFQNYCYDIHRRFVAHISQMIRGTKSIKYNNISFASWRKIFIRLRCFYNLYPKLNWSAEQRNCNKSSRLAFRHNNKNLCANSTSCHWRFKWRVRFSLGGSLQACTKKFAVHLTV